MLWLNLQLVQKWVGPQLLVDAGLETGRRKKSGAPNYMSGVKLQLGQNVRPLQFHVEGGLATGKNGSDPQLHIEGEDTIVTKLVGPIVAYRGLTCNWDKKGGLLITCVSMMDVQLGRRVACCGWTCN